jgi:hypothetical protein
MRKLLYILILSVTSSGCKKSALCDCFRGSGDVITEQRAAEPFHYVELYNKIDLFYHYSADYRIEVVSGEKLIDKITTEINDGKLVIDNENKCNWVRDFDSRFEVHIYLPALDTVEVFDSPGNITFVDEVDVPRFSFQSWSSSGDYRLKVNSWTCFFALQTGPASLVVTGKSSVAYLWNQGQGLYDASGLISDDIYSTNRGSNHMYMHAFNRLHSRIEFSGNIYYSGNPTDKKLEDFGGGDFIELF